MSRISYATKCPTCHGEGRDASLYLETDDGKIHCTSEDSHSFDSMPGESPTKVQDIRSAILHELEPRTESPDREPSAEEVAASENRMREIVSQSTAATLPAETVQPAAPVATVPVQQKPLSHLMEMVGEGDALPLPGGDVLCCIRVPEQWVSALAAQGEDERPKKNLAEVLQGLVENGLLEWFSNAPAVR